MKGMGVFHQTCIHLATVHRRLVGGGSESISLKIAQKQLSNEKNPSCLGFIGDYITQLW